MKSLQPESLFTPYFKRICENGPVWVLKFEKKGQTNRRASWNWPQGLACRTSLGSRRNSITAMSQPRRVDLPDGLLGKLPIPGRGFRSINRDYFLLRARARSGILKA